MTLILPGPELQVQIRKALNEDVNTRDRDLGIIKEWLRQQPHLPDTWDDKRLMNFLRGCNFSLEKAKKKIDMYFTMRAAVPEFFVNRDITRPEFQVLKDLLKAAPLPGLTPDGKRVTVIAAAKEDFDTPDIADAMKLAFMMGDIRLEMEETGVAGDVYILDANVANMKHFVTVSPIVVKKFFICLQEAYPVKLKEVHIVNISPFVDFLISWVKPFLKEKIRKRIHVHKDFETLKNFVPEDVLPVEYGGKGGRIFDYMEEWLKRFQEYAPWFKEQENVKADESKRPGKPTNYDDLFGLEGSFKKLNID